LLGGYNTHTYAINPTGWVDPLGLQGQKRDAKGKFTSESCPNIKSGADYESDVEGKLRRNPSVEVLGMHVQVKTPLGDRFVDVLFRNKKTNQIYAGEVKSNCARRDALQKSKDLLIDAGQGVYGTGDGVPVDLRGKQAIGVRTIEIRPQK
jgi:hypothetical protein